MAKTRAQRKAEKRRREEEAARQRQAGDGAERDKESRAQQRTQTPASGDVAEAEAVMETGARTEDYGEHTVEHDQPEGAQASAAAVPGVTPEPVVPTQDSEPEAPAPSRADVGAPDTTERKESREERRARKQKEKQQRKQQRERELQKAAGEKPEKRRGAVMGFFASCWAELKKVQWPDRDTLVQASAVTLIFVAIMAAYLGALDAAFNWLVKQIL
jgi:preprotein translocase SecE subunit